MLRSVVKDIAIEIIAKDSDKSESWLRSLSNEDFEHQLCLYILKSRIGVLPEELTSMSTSELRDYCENYLKKHKRNESVTLLKLLT